MNTPRKLKGVIAILSLLLASGGAFAYDSAMAVAGSAATTVAIAPSALDESLELPSAAPGEVLRSLPPLKPIDLTLQADDLWQRIRHGFAMPDLVSDLVADRQAYYLERPEYLIRMVERSRRYLHHIVEELERRGMLHRIGVASDGLKRLQPDGPFQRACIGTLAIHPVDRQELQPLAELVVRPAPRCRRIDQRGPRLPADDLRDAWRLAPRLLLSSAYRQLSPASRKGQVVGFLN